jgi:hypothetical protein
MKSKKKILMMLLAIGILLTLGNIKTSAKVKLNKTKVTIHVGESYKLKVKGTKKKVTWKSSKKSVVTVNKKGVVTGKKAGKSTITAKVGKKKLKCKITVIVKAKNNSETSNGTTENQSKKIVMTIDGKEISVTWKDNDSVKALKELLKDKSIVIKMSKYGGFEQVGSIGKTLPSNDKNITTKPGDIVLYSDDQIVMFYGSNTWDYTRLGTINLSESELKSLLGNKNVILKLELK